MYECWRFHPIKWYLPGDVKPGHIMFAPDSTNFMAPLSTCIIGMIVGNLCSSFIVGKYGPPWWLKNNTSPLTLTNSILSYSKIDWQKISSIFDFQEKSLRITFTWHFDIIMDFLGRISSMMVSNLGYCAQTEDWIALWTEFFICEVELMFSSVVNFLNISLTLTLSTTWYQPLVNLLVTLELSIDHPVSSWSPIFQVGAHIFCSYYIQYPSHIPHIYTIIPT